MEAESVSASVFWARADVTLLLIHLGNVLLLMGQTVYQNAARRQVLREAVQAPFAGGHTGVTGQPFLQLGVFDGPAQQRQNPIVAPS